MFGCMTWLDFEAHAESVRCISPPSQSPLSTQPLGRPAISFFLLFFSLSLAVKGLGHREGIVLGTEFDKVTKEVGL